MLELRAMLKKDIPAVLELSNRVFGEMAWNERDFCHAVEKDYDFPYVLYADGDFAGFCLLRQLGPEAEVQEICIVEEHRGRGYGEALMDQMIRTAQSLSGSSIFLEVRAGNASARGLYRKKGFTELYIRKNYYTGPTEDAVVMELKL